MASASPSIFQALASGSACPVGSACCLRHPRACTPATVSTRTRHAPPPPPAIHDYHYDKAFTSPLPMQANCAGCQHAIDVRCPYARKTATHHRVIDCVVPMYGGLSVQLERWRNDAATSHQQLCLIGESEVMYPFARALLPPLRHLTYVAAEAAGQGQPYDRNLTTRPHCSEVHVPPPQRWRVHEEPDHEGLCTGVSPSRTCRVLHPGEASRELHRDVRAMMSRRTDGDGAITVLIARNRTSSRGRAFNAEDEAALLKRLHAASGLPTVLYTGQQSLAETLALFARAAVVVGIHGAGLTNSVFTPHPTCVVEISTWVDRAHHARWRTSGDYTGRTDSSVPRWSRYIDWRVHRLTPEQIVASLSQEQQVRHLPIYHRISPYLLISPHISSHLLTSPHISSHLLISPTEALLVGRTRPVTPE